MIIEAISRPRRYLVHHSSHLVSEDLREILQATGPCAVEVTNDLRRANVQPYDVAFLDVEADDMDADVGLSWLRKMSERIVLLTSGLSDSVQAPPKFVFLPQPFRSSDVLNVLEELGISATGRV